MSEPAVHKDGEAGATPQAGEPEKRALGLQGITVDRGKRTVVRDVSIEIPAGEVTALLGPNGAGKSSLVLAVGGVLGLQAGSVMLDGRDFAGRRPERIRAAGISRGTAPAPARARPGPGRGAGSRWPPGCCPRRSGP